MLAPGRCVLLYGGMAGAVFGPKPRSYAYWMPKKKYRAALQSALSAKLIDGNVIVVSEFALEQPKTKLLAKALDQFGIGRDVPCWWLRIRKFAMSPGRQKIFRM